MRSNQLKPCTTDTLVSDLENRSEIVMYLSHF